MSIITLTTDFGTDDAYVGEMKGALLTVHPTATLVDLTHAISPGNVREGAWVVAHAWESFPPGTLHVAVVDPGVGSARRAIAVRSGGHLFLAPDNGLLHGILVRRDAQARAIGDEHRAPNARGTTFDGRDLFAPLAGRLAGGLRFEAIGAEAGAPVLLSPFDPIPEQGGWCAEIVRCDRFGNLVTAASRSFLESTFGARWREIRVVAGSREISPVRTAYAAVSPGELLLTIGSADTLEIGCNGGSARDVLEVTSGDRVRILSAEFGRSR